MGFIEAQQELTVLTIVIPILYVALYTTVNAALQLSFGLVVFGGALVLAEATRTYPPKHTGFACFLVGVLSFLFVVLFQ